MSIETFLKDFDVVNFNKDMGNWKKTSWLNIGRDIKSTAGTAERCKTQIVEAIYLIWNPMTTSRCGLEFKLMKYVIM